MSELSSAKPDKEWLPNLMFDAVNNPFAMQNLMRREAETFSATADGRSAKSFVASAIGDKGERAPSAFQFNAQTGLGPQTSFRAHATGSLAGETTAAAVPKPTTDTDLPQAEEEQTTIMADAGQDEAATDAQHADENREVVHAEVDAELQADADADTEIDTKIETETETEQGDVIAASAQEAMNEIDEIDDAATVDTDTELKTAVEALADAQAEPEVVAATPDLSSEAMTALLDAAREEARAAAREEGFDAGYAQAQSELKKEHDAQIEALQKLNAGVQELANDSDALFEPLHKLALHLAEQLVRGELTQSGLAISRLVDNALREMTGSGEKAVMVQLNPDDLELYRPLVAQLGDSMTLRSNTALKRGSVRVSLDGSVVEDLIERRIEGLGKSLAQPPAAGWRNGPGTSLSARLESGSGARQTVQDVTAKDVAAPTPSDSTVEMMADAVEASGDGDHA